MAEYGGKVIGYIHACDYDVIYGPSMKIYWDLQWIPITESWEPEKRFLQPPKTGQRKQAVPECVFALGHSEKEPMNSIKGAAIFAAKSSLILKSMCKI